MSRAERQRVLDEHAAMYRRESEAVQAIAARMNLRQKQQDLTTYRQQMERCAEIKRMNGAFSMGG